MSSASEKLEVTGEDPRERAAQSMLAEKPKKPNICAPENNSLLSRMADFLPKMKAANQEVEQELASGAPASKFDIEAVSEDDAHIEMKLHLGVAEELEKVPMITQMNADTGEAAAIITQMDADSEDESMAAEGEDAAADL